MDIRPGYLAVVAIRGLDEMDWGGGMDDVEFSAAAIRAFSFLSCDYGMSLVEDAGSRVRFESTNRFVVVHWGRRSYEVTVRIGRWVEVQGERLEQFYYLQNILELHNAGNFLPKAVSATNEASAIRQVERLGELTAEYGARVLQGDDAEFAELSMANSKHSQENELVRRRAQAALAWSAKDYESVDRIFREIDRELPLVLLTKSEQAKWAYSAKRLSDPG